MRLLRQNTLFALALTLCFATSVSAVTLNEIRIDQPGSDNDEYVELAGSPGESLDGISLIVIGDGAGGSGTVEEITDLSGFSVQADGFFLIADSTFSLPGTADLLTDLNCENSDNVTYMLVRGLNQAMNVGGGFGGSDLDADDDGNIDPTGDYDGDTIDDGAPWAAMVDCVGLVETVGSGDLIYCSTTVGPDGTFVPGHVFLCPTGWVIGVFDPTDPLALDSPDAANNCTVGVEETTWSQTKTLYR